MQEISGSITALPLIQQFALDVCAPPVLAAIWWLQGRSNALDLQSGQASEETQSRQKKGFWLVLGVLYLLMFGATAYFNLT